MLHRRAAYAALAVVLAFSMSSCDSADILQPTDAAPQFNQGNGNGKHNAPGQQKKLWNALDGTAENAGASADTTVDRRGGSLAVTATTADGAYAFSLVIPKNAVRSPTTFTMIVADGNAVGVDLTAENAAGEDVGSRGFNRPVTLCLNVTGLVNETRSLGLALDEAGEFFPIATYQFTNPKDGDDYLCGDLQHFSRFIIIHN